MGIDYFNQYELNSLQILLTSYKHLFKLNDKIKNIKNIKNIKKIKKRNTAIFIGATTGVIVALEKKINVIHICFDSIFDSYNQSLWQNLIVKQVSKNTFIYKLKKYNTFLKFNNSRNCYKKYYEI